jgi:hypothetical protein
MCALRNSRATDGGSGSDSERLAASTTGPEYPRKRKSAGRSTTSGSGQGTKSLRDSGEVRLVLSPIAGVVAFLRIEMSLTFIEDAAPLMIGHMTIRNFTPKISARLNHDLM